MSIPQALSLTTGAASRRAVAIVAHGSRSPEANRSFERFVTSYAARRPEHAVSHAYVELAEPALESALLDITERHRTVVVAPLLLFAAGHVKSDVPLVLSRVRQARPGVELLPAPALGVHPSLLELLRARTAEAAQGSTPEKTAVVVVGRGSSDADANGDFCKLVRLLAEGTSYQQVLPCFAGVTAPSLKRALELVARSRPEAVVVVPYLLFAGRILTALQTTLDEFRRGCPWIRVRLGEILESDPRVLDALDDRVSGALSGSRPLACDTCQFRVPVSKVAGTVGGLKALLWSVRHSLTHNQAAPHAHAHAPLARHVLVCGNADCADRGSIALISQLRRLVKSSAAHDRTVRITRTHCMGRCGEGPTVCVYPDGIWYRGVQPSDAEELFREHIVGERLVGRLVDSIMQ